MGPLFKSYRDLPKAVYFLFVVRIITGIGNFVYPFLTLFLTEKLGMSTKVAGLYFMAFSIVQGVGVIAGGKLCDHVKRKGLLLLCMTMGGILLGSCTFTGNTMVTAYVIVCSGLFLGAQMAVSSAMINDITRPENRKQSFSLLYLGNNLGFMIGPTLAGLLYRSHASLIFLGNGISALLAVYLIYRFIPDSTPTVEDMESEELSLEEAHDGDPFLVAIAKRPVLLMFLFGRLVLTFCYASISFVIPLQMTNAFGSSQGPALYGVLMSVTGFVVISCTIPATKLTEKLKPLVSIGIASLLYGLGYGMMGHVSLFGLMLLAGFIFTLGEIIEATNSGVFVANRAPINQRGRFNALSQIISNAGYAVAPSFFGVMIEDGGLVFTWNVIMALALLAGGYMFYLARLDQSMTKIAEEKAEA